MERTKNIGLEKGGQANGNMVCCRRQTESGNLSRGQVFRRRVCVAEPIMRLEDPGDEAG